MINPWTAISHSMPGGFVLDCDKPFMAVHNHCAKDYDHQFHSDFTPEPRLGSINAPVYILLGNPSYERRGTGMPSDEINRAIKSMHDEHHPHLGAIDKDNQGWTSSLKVLREEMEARGSPVKLEERICSVGFSPYRSISLAHAHVRFPSQEYTFSLIKNAIRERPDTLFILTRSIKEWGGAIPELLSKNISREDVDFNSGSKIPRIAPYPESHAPLHPNVIIGKNPRISHLSRKNLGSTNFERVVNAICG